MRSAVACLLICVGCDGNAETVPPSDAATSDVDSHQTDGPSGGCGASCGGTCSDGRCVEQLVTTNSNVGVIATDGVNLYWSTVKWNGGATCTTPPCATLNRVPVGGGAPVQLFDADPDDLADGPVIDGDSVYWLVGDNLGVAASIWKMPLAGGLPSQVVSGRIIPPLAVANGHLFYTVVTPLDGGPNYTATLTTSPTAGGSSVALAQTGGGQGNFTTAIAGDALSVYWGAQGEANPEEFLYGVPIDGSGQPVTVATPGPFVALQTDATYVYYATGGNVARVPRGGGVSLVLASVSSSPSLIGTNMVIDAANVFFTDPQTGLLEKVALGGGPVTSLGVGGNLGRSTEGRGIAVDTTSAYWCTREVVAKATKGAKQNAWQQSVDGGKTWIDLPPTTKATTTVQNLTSGATVSFRHRVFTKAGWSNWTDSVSTLVV